MTDPRHFSKATTRMSHTPGPWHLWNTERGGLTISMRYQWWVVTCQRSGWDHRAEESIANGLLMAAAPDLLEALKLSDRALSKAREMLGVFEDNGGHDGLGGKGYLATIDHMDEARARNRAAIAKAKGAAP